MTTTGPAHSSRQVPDWLADMAGSVVVNPSAIGNPDETPRIFAGSGLRSLLNPCTADAPSQGGYCGGVNGWHADDCPTRSAPQDRP